MQFWLSLRSNRLSHRESYRHDRATIDGRLGRLLERTNGAPGEANGPLFLYSQPALRQLGSGWQPRREWRVRDRYRRAVRVHQHVHAGIKLLGQRFDDGRA